MSAATIQTLLKTSTKLHEQVTKLATELSVHSLDNGIQPSNGSNGSQETTADLRTLWEARDGDDSIEKTKANIIGLAYDLEKLTLGPHGFIHELVSVNWEHCALYVALEHGVLDALPSDGSTQSLAEIATLVGLQPHQLLPICRLLACSGLISEAEPGSFGHTFISTALTTNDGFRSWVGFQ